jgi:MFS family permease
LPDTKETRIRYFIICILFVVSCFSFADRSALSQAVSLMPKEMDLTPQRMGYLLFGFGWAYALGQLPSGGLLDRFGSKRVYGIAIILWSTFAFLTGCAGFVKASMVFSVIFVLRILSGLAQAPVFPGNGRIVAAWFPTSERGSSSAIFNSSQYFALPIFAPIFGGLLHRYGWQSCFWFLGALGAVLTVVWFTNIYGVKDHPRISLAEIETIERGGGLVDTDAQASAKKNTLTWATVKMLLSHRTLVSFSRKLPIMAGMALSMMIIACNYADTQTMMLVFMSISFFGKGIGALGWTVISDTSPKGMVGMNGALFNLCGNMAGVTTPLIIGPIVGKTHSYNGALIFVGLIAFCAIVSYGLIVGEIKRLELAPAVPAEGVR